MTRKPCPFCGETTALETARLTYAALDPESGYWKWEAFCRACSASVAAASETGAVTRWHTRAPAPLTDLLKNNPALVDELLIDFSATAHEMVVRVMDKTLTAGDISPLRALILAWVQRVETEAAADSENNENGGPGDDREPQYEL